MSKLLADDEKIQLCEIVCVSHDATRKEEMRQALAALLEPRNVVWLVMRERVRLRVPRSVASHTGVCKRRHLSG